MSKVKVALIGKPNVGKSSLYNIIVGLMSGKKSFRKSSKYRGNNRSIVNSKAGTTRDLIRSNCQFEGLEYELIDSPGYNFDDKDELHALYDKNCLKLLSEADILVLVLDGKFGLSSLDHELITRLRKQTKPYITCVNKSDAKNFDGQLLDISKLGFKTIIQTSASSSSGIYDLQTKILNIALEQKLIEPRVQEKYLTDGEDELSSDEFEDSSNIVKSDKRIRVSLVGKVNVGKSSLINSILGEEVQVSTSIAGYTRDNVAYEYSKNDRNFILIDTAGRRRRAKLTDEIDKYLHFNSKQTYLGSDIVCLILSAVDTISKEDLRISSEVLELGRCLLIAVNKTDLLSSAELKEYLKELEIKVSTSVTGGKNYKIVGLSALKGYGLDRLFNSICDLYDRSRVEISTSKLNRWLRDTYFNNPPPMRKRRENQLKYITQISYQPPKFVIFCSSAKDIPNSYQRFLVNKFAKDFDLQAVPLKIILKDNPNPYTKKK